MSFSSVSIWEASGGESDGFTDDDEHDNSSTPLLVSGLIVDGTCSVVAIEVFVIAGRGSVGFSLKLVFVEISLISIASVWAVDSDNSLLEVETDFSVTFTSDNSFSSCSTFVFFVVSSNLNARFSVSESVSFSLSSSIKLTFSL